MLSTTIGYVFVNRHQLMRFVLVGVATFIFNLSLVWLIYGLLKFDYRIAVTCAYIMTVLVHFLLNRSFTYKYVGSHAGSGLPKYGVTLLINYLITFSITAGTVEILKLAPYYGVLFSTFVTGASGFLLMKYFVFRVNEDKE